MMEFDEDDIVVSDGFDSDGKGDESDEDKLSTLTDREKQEVYFQRRKHKKEAQERLELAAKHKPVGLEESDENINEIDEAHKEIITHLLSLVVTPQLLASQFNSPFLPKLIKRSLFYLPTQKRIVIGSDVIFKTSEPYLFNNQSTTMYLETSKIPTKEVLKFTEVQGTVSTGDITSAVSWFAENVLITNNIQPFLDTANLSKIAEDKRELENGNYKVDKQVRLFKIKKKAYSDLDTTKLSVTQLMTVIKDLSLVSDDEIIKEESELKESIQKKVAMLKETMCRLEKATNEKKKAEQGLLLEKLKKKYSKKTKIDEIGTKSYEIKIKSIKEWLEEKSVNTSLSEKNMVRGIMQKIKDYKI